MSDFIDRLFPYLILVFLSLSFVFAFRSIHSPEDEETKSLMYSVECYDGGRKIYSKATIGKPSVDHGVWYLKEYGTTRYVRITGSCIVSGWKE